MSFKIIAFKTGDRLLKDDFKKSKQIKSDPYKIIQSNKIYQFSNYYDFPNKDFSQINLLSNNNIDLYSFKVGDKELNININAIVGSNGSGKSTLMELLYIANYNIGCNLGLLDNESNTPIEPFIFLNLEIIYRAGHNKHVRLKFQNGRILKQIGWLRDSQVIFNEEAKEVLDSADLSDYFYTIVVNYSHYALNSEETGDWITHLFHKNDGYQTPIVLNPMRTEGNIDINREKHLLNRRLLSNILEYVGDNENVNESLRNLVNGKIAHELKLTFALSSTTTLNEPKNIDSIKLIRDAIEQHFNFSIAQESMDNDYYTIISLNYIHTKLNKISKLYAPYFKYNDRETIKNINELFVEIKNSNSHIVFKIKGTILYLKYRKEIFSQIKHITEKPFILNINTLSNTIKYIDDSEDFLVNTFMMVPPAFFHVEIIPKGGSSFESFSSGEKQRIHSISSIVYHLINLNSVEEIKGKEKRQYLKYENVNIILDEIELYYHPDWQRNYITDLLDYIKKISAKNLKNIRSLNITFLTHSPFILSDIPSSNILFLEESGEPISDKLYFKSFGANIHDLLRHTFFLKSGSMGEFAKTKINETINFLLARKDYNSKIASIKNNHPSSITNPENDSLIQNIAEILELKRHRGLIEIIDEPILKRKLSELYDEATGENLELNIIRQKISELQAYEAKLNKNR